MERTRAKTRAVLLKGCKRHCSERVGIKPKSLRRAVGQAEADQFMRRSGKLVEGKFQSDFTSEEPEFEQVDLVFINRKKLIRFLESAPVIPEDQN